MNILISGGGTREDIDPVRGIINYSTGRLAGLIAERFINAGNSVTYICGEGAKQPKENSKLEIITIRNVAQLQKQLEKALHERPYDRVIHAMAVSDYSPYAFAPADSLELGNLKLNELNKKAKTSSDSAYLVLILKQQPKLIKIIKKIQPNTILMGFKLLCGASLAELTEAASKQMDDSLSDYVLANNLEDIYEGTHKAILMSKDGIIGRPNTKEEIADLIYEVLA